MIEGKSVLAIIPARGGSKRVPSKNIRDVAGKPLITWTIEEAKKSVYIDRLILSSDDRQIIDVARQWGCEVPFVRPKELAEDDTPGIDPVLHALSILPGYEYVVLLQVTSPLRTVADIDSCIEKCIQFKANSCVSVSEVDKSPLWMYTLEVHGFMSPFVDKSFEGKDMKKIYILNGAVYVAEVRWLKEYRKFVDEGTVAYVMPNERSLDIDTEFDLKILQYFLMKSEAL